MSSVSPGRLKQKDAVEILDAMVGESSVEWDGATKSTAIIYWRKPEEWANAIYEWIDNTGQKGSVLTLYEISEGDLTVSQGLSRWDSAERIPWRVLLICLFWGGFFAGSKSSMESIRIFSGRRSMSW